MRRHSAVLAVFAVVLALPSIVAAEEPVDLAAVTRIRDEGLNRSQVMETARVLADEIGPRVTNSPGYRRAADWTRGRLAEWGLSNAHLEPFEFGRGWSFSACSLRLVKPDVVQLDALPKGFSPGTAGVLRGGVVRVAIEKDEDFEAYRGTLAGKIVLLAAPPEPEREEAERSARYTDEELAEIETFPVSDRRFDEFRRRLRREAGIGRKRAEFLAAEGALATIEASSREAALIRVGGNPVTRPGEKAGLPAVVLGQEQFGRIVRMLERKVDVELEVLVEATFHDDRTTADNVVAELAGSDRRDEVVMLGAHLDSWHAGTGATDNAAGVAVVMEAMRILKAIDAKPRRTVRVGLWAAEEQGLRGSRAYVAEHFASRPESDDPAQRDLPEWSQTGRKPLEFKPDWKKLSAYFNLDNGGGKIRGIHAQENASLRPIFAAWLEPLADLGATTVTLRRTGGTDHQSFDGVGLPGFQFVQDRLDYMTRTHHTQADTYERLHAADLKQAAVVMATFAYHAAMRDELLPRKPVPRDEPPAAGRERAGGTTPPSPGPRAETPPTARPSPRP
ncbi:MAG: M20/M25/M40 family metallo-hydrolase [Acidobacteria bacterium]|nr:M20/M25/M40 family metallo-hydrolase [Acidobacteriota bacterium]